MQLIGTTKDLCICSRPEMPGFFASLRMTSSKHFLAESSCRLNRPRNGCNDPLKLRDLHLELHAAQRRKPVVARPAIPGRRAPLGLHPPFDQHPLESGIKGTLLHLQDFVGDLLDPPGDLIAVQLAATASALRISK